MRRSAGIVALFLSAAVGLWLLAAPGVLGMTGAVRLNHLIVGPMAATLAVIAMSASTRLVVRMNIALGAWLCAAPLLLDHGGWWVESVIAGAALIVLALVPQGEGERFAGGWSSLIGGAEDAAQPDRTGQGGRP